MRACASRPRVLRAVNPASPSTRHLVARSSDNAQLQHESMEVCFSCLSAVERPENVQMFDRPAGARDGCALRLQRIPQHAEPCEAL